MISTTDLQVSHFFVCIALCSLGVSNYVDWMTPVIVQTACLNKGYTLLVKFQTANWKFYFKRKTNTVSEHFSLSNISSVTYPISIYNVLQYFQSLQLKTKTTVDVVFELSYVFTTTEVRVHSYGCYFQSLESTNFWLQFSLRK